MIATAKRLAVAAVTALAITTTAMPTDANARHVKHVRIVAPPPPSFGYYGQFPLELDYAQAWSLEEPYYRHFMYDYCDYRNCVLGPDLTPRWYGPPG